MLKNIFTSIPHDNITNKNNSNDNAIPKKKKQKIKGNYILEETIGEGAFAKVKLGKHIYTGEKVAIKILNKNKLFQDINDGNSNNDIILKDIKKIRKEINILKRLKHRNVIQLYEIMESKTNLYIIMEYCEGKELFDYIVKNKFLSEKEACFFFQQIIDGVEYLHLSNITHRDLKPENLLLDKNNRICISDFGLSTITDDMNSLLETPCGTPSYAPPEMLRGDKYNGVFTDIWSCGIILYSMLVGSLPCAESKEELIYKNIMNHNYYFPNYLSKEAIDLMENILNVNPDERYNFDQIKSHKWFNIIKPKLKPGVIFGVHKIPIDEKILEKVEKYGYDKKKCYESVKNNVYDSNTSIYYLLLKQSIDASKSSISDLYSDEYLKYIKDANNWIIPEKINDILYKNYNNNSCNYFSTIRVNTFNNYTMNNKDDFEAIPEESNKENESINESYFNNDEENIKKMYTNNVIEPKNKNKYFDSNNNEFENEKKRVSFLIRKNKENKNKKKKIPNNFKNNNTLGAIGGGRKRNSANKNKENNNDNKKQTKIFNDIVDNIKNDNVNYDNNKYTSKNLRSSKPKEQKNDKENEIDNENENVEQETVKEKNIKKVRQKKD